METKRIRDCDIAYELKGEGGTPVLFLNGIAMTIGHWGALGGILEPNHQCLYHDFRGQLMSGKPEDGYSLESHADDVKELMNVLGIEKAHIVGTSYGSEIAMIFVMAYPESCLSLTVIDGVSELDAVLETAVDSWKLTALADPVLFYRTILPWNYSPSYIEANREGFRSREEVMKKLPREYYEAFSRLCDAFLAINLTPKLGLISCPTLVIVAERDILKHRLFAEIITRGIPGAELRIVPGAGHAVVIERPAELGEMIRDWIGNL